jgi:mannose-6-phosphate isomerase-like protein (cupin superfamily)
MRTRTALVIALFSVSGAFGFAQTAGRGGGEGRTPIVERAPADHSVAIPLAKLQQYYKDMDGKKQQTLRMLEGGRYNVNIRRITNAETALVHPDTADVWVVTEGAGTLTTGGTLEGGKIVGGESRTSRCQRRHRQHHVAEYPVRHELLRVVRCTGMHGR